jgi:hypothetical protein
MARVRREKIRERIIILLSFCICAVVYGEMVTGSS